MMAELLEILSRRALSRGLYLGLLCPHLLLSLAIAAPFLMHLRCRLYRYIHTSVINLYALGCQLPHVDAKMHQSQDGNRGGPPKQVAAC